MSFCTMKPFEINIIHSSCLMDRQNEAKNVHTMGGTGSDKEHYKLFHMFVSKLEETFSLSL